MNPPPTTNAKEESMKVLSKALLVIIGLVVSVTVAMGAEYYLPYMISSDTQGTGLAVRNLSTTESANVTVTTYSQSGTAVETLDIDLDADGQTAFITASGTAVEGWTHVESDQPLSGLSFVAKSGGGNYMADIPFSSKTSYLLTIPHLDQGNNWDTVVMACNPNSSSAVLTVTVVDRDGNTVTSSQYQMSANGSRTISIASMTSGSVNGSIQLSCTQPFAAFALYNNLKTGNYSYAGINAVSPLEENGGWVLYDDFSSGSIDPAKWNTDESSATIAVENGEARFTHQSGFPNDSSWLMFTNPDKILAVKAAIRVGTCAGDVRGRIGGNILDDASGNIVWQALQIQDGSDRIYQWIEADEPGTYNLVNEISYAEFETPITISGNTFYCSVVFALPYLQSTVDGYGTVMYKPEGFVSESANPAFMGIGTRSTNGDGPCSIYFDDVYVIYKD